MPEMTFVVQWPGGRTQSCYSPSLVMHDYLEVGTRYSTTEFVRLAAEALNEASERVRAKYGVYCTSAMAQLDEIEAVARISEPGEVLVLSMTGQLPTDATSLNGIAR